MPGHCLITSMQTWRQSLKMFIVLKKGNSISYRRTIFFSPRYHTLCGEVICVTEKCIFLYCFYGVVGVFKYYYTAFRNQTTSILQHHQRALPRTLEIKGILQVAWRRLGCRMYISCHRRLTCLFIMSVIHLYCDIAVQELEPPDM
jgi:hypothetical protein